MLFSQRQSTQIEELESLKSQLQQPSSRSRNLSTERQQRAQQQIEYNRQKQKVQSFSVEKSLNLSQQNSKVENLVASWQHIKQSTSLNQGSNHNIPITQFESQGRTSNRPQIIIEEDNLFTEETEQQQPIPHSNKNHSKSRKTPSSTRPHAKSIKEQQSIDITKKTITEKVVPKKPFSNQGNYAQRPQTTKMASSQYVKSSPQVYKEHSLHIQKSDQTKINNTINSAGYSNNVNSRTKANAYKQIVKKGSMCTEGQIENQYIADLVKLKEQILATYLKQNRALITSQTQIAKNFEEILQILKQDFPQQ